MEAITNLRMAEGFAARTERRSVEGIGRGRARLIANERKRGQEQKNEERNAKTIHGGLPSISRSIISPYV